MPTVRASRFLIPAACQHQQSTTHSLVNQLPYCLLSDIYSLTNCCAELTDGRSNLNNELGSVQTSTLATLMAKQVSPFTCCNRSVCRWTSDASSHQQQQQQLLDASKHLNRKTQRWVSHSSAQLGSWLLWQKIKCYWTTITEGKCVSCVVSLIVSLLI